MNTTLLAKARKAQTKINAKTAEYENARAEKIKAAQTETEIFRAEIDRAFLALASLEKVPVSPYEWCGGNESYFVSLCNYREIKIEDKREYQSDFTGENKHAAYYISKDFWFTIQRANQKFNYSVWRNVYSKDEIARWLDLKPGYSWKQRGLDPINATFTTLEAMVSYIEEFAVKIVDVERYESLILQTERAAVLAEHLAIDAKLIKAEQDRKLDGVVFAVEKKSYRVLTPKEIPLWFGQYIASAPEKFFDAELLSKNSHGYITALDWHKMRELSPKGLNEVMRKTVSLESYGKAMAERNSFEKFVIPYKNYFVVDLSKLEQV